MFIQPPVLYSRVCLTCNITHLGVCGVFQSLLQLRLQDHLLALGDPRFCLGNEGLSWSGEEIVDELKKKQRDKTRAEVEELCANTLVDLKVLHFLFVKKVEIILIPLKTSKIIHLLFIDNH